MNALLPSGVWIVFFRDLWAYLSGKDRLLVCASILVPAINRIATLASFGLSLKFTSMAVNGQVAPETEIIIGVAIFCAFLFASLVHWAQGNLEHALEGLAGKIMRRLLASELLKIRFGPEDGREKLYIEFKRSESGLLIRASEILVTLVSMIAIFVLLASLVAILFYLSSAIGAVLLIFGGVMLVFLRNRIRIPKNTSNGKLSEARKELAQIGRSLALGIGDAGELSEAYNRNQVVELQREVQHRRRVRRGKISALVGVGSAILMTAIFILASEGYFDSLEPVRILVTVLAVRLCVAQGRSGLEKWGELLSRRQTLFTLRRLLADHVNEIKSSTESLKVPNECVDSQCP